MSTTINDFANDTLTAQVIAPQLLTATTTNATGTDFILGDGPCWMELALGSWNATSLSVQVQQSTTTNASFTDITGAVIAATTAQSGSIQKINFRRDSQYLRVIATVSGTTIGISCILGEQYKVL